MKKFNYNQCGKYFAKGFKLKVHTQNVHEIEKIRYESTNDFIEMISIFKNLQNSNVKFVKKKSLTHYVCFSQEKIPSPFLRFYQFCTKLVTIMVKEVLPNDD